MQLIPREELSKPSAAKAAALLILDHLEAEYARRLECRVRIWDLVWSNPEATHAEIFAEMGTISGRVFEASAEDARSLRTLAAIWGHDPKEALPDCHTFAPVVSLPQDDGSVIFPDSVEEEAPLQGL